MINMKYLLLTAVFCLIPLIGCSSNRDTTIPDNISSCKIHSSVRQKLQDGSYNDAIHELELLGNACPFSPYLQQVQFGLIYAYYKSSNFLLAKDFIDRFLRLNPTHPNIDYIIYMRGLINMEIDNSPLQEFFFVDHSDRNSEHVNAAFYDFKKLVQDHPNSQYAVDAIKRLVYLKNLLAKHELSIVKYYDKRSAYLAVVNRVEQMIRNFPDTQATHQALFYMEKAYRELKLKDQADKVLRIRVENSA